MFQKRGVYQKKETLPAGTTEQNCLCLAGVIHRSCKSNEYHLFYVTYLRGDERCSPSTNYHGCCNPSKVSHNGADQEENLVKVCFIIFLKKL